jgi:hypothetical protein
MASESQLGLQEVLAPEESQQYNNYREGIIKLYANI